MNVTRLLATAAAGIVLLSGCHGGSKDVPSSTDVSPSVAVSSAPVVKVVPLSHTGKVDLTSYGQGCDKDPCWLPTQFHTTVVAGETVSQNNVWPKQGDSVTVLCYGNGQTYRAGDGKEHNTWFGILVPTDKLEPGAAEKATKVSVPNVGDGYVSFVQSAWISGLAGKKLIGCYLLQ